MPLLDVDFFCRFCIVFSFITICGIFQFVRLTGLVDFILIDDRIISDHIAIYFSIRSRNRVCPGIITMGRHTIIINSICTNLKTSLVIYRYFNGTAIILHIFSGILTNRIRDCCSGSGRKKLSIIFYLPLYDLIAIRTGLQNRPIGFTCIIQINCMMELFLCGWLVFWLSRNLITGLFICEFTIDRLA